RADDMLPPGAPERERLAGALRAAALIGQLVRHIEEESGIAIPGGLPDTVAHGGAPEEPPQPFPGEYRFRALIAEGSFGRVWLADDLRLRVPVALKTLHPRGGVERRSQALAALENDARKLVRVKHPNIVQVHAWRQAGDEHYLVMQYVPGLSLKARL